MTQRIFRVIRSQPKFGMGHSSVREDMARAETLAREWSKELFTPSEVEEWLRRLPQIDAKTASALRSAGISAAEAAHRYHTARGFLPRMPLALRVSTGEISVDEALALVVEYRRRANAS